METEKNTYEISFLARTEEGAGTVLRYLSQVGADVTGEQRIEQINLAYPIKKHSSAYLGCIHFALKPGEVETLKDTLRFEEGILRYTIVTPPFVKEADFQPRGPRIMEKTLSERPSGGDAVASNEDLEAKLEEISGSLDSEA